MVTTEIDDKKVKITLNHIKDASKDMKRPFRIIAQEMRESVRENFEVGGRFSKAGSVIGGTSKWAKGKFGGSLIRTGNLRDSITSKSDENGAQVGTNLKYAAIHNFGGKIKEHDVVARNGRALKFVVSGKTLFRKKAHIPTMDIPARPFMVVQPEDIEGFKETILEHLTGDVKP